MLAALATTSALALSACGGDSIDDADGTDAGGGAGTAATLNMAVNPWVGYEADAYVVGDVAETQLGCTVNYKNLNEEVSWQGFGTGDGRRRHRELGPPRPREEVHRPTRATAAPWTSG